MGPKNNKFNLKYGVDSPKKVSRLGLASRGPLSTKTPIYPLGQQNPSLEDCKPFLGDRLGCGWGWASRRSSGAASLPLDTSNGTPPHSNIPVAFTQPTWNNVSMHDGHHESWLSSQPVKNNSPPSVEKIPKNLSFQGTPAEASKWGDSSPGPQGEISASVGRHFFSQFAASIQ